MSHEIMQLQTQILGLTSKIVELSAKHNQSLKIIERITNLMEDMVINDERLQSEIELLKQKAKQ